MCIEKSASDLHITENEPPILRIDGSLQRTKLPKLDKQELKRMIYGIRTNAQKEIFEKELRNKDIATWNKPNGGYFISLNILDGCAKKAVLLAREAGVVLTGAGATYPYGNDPHDRNIRIAPTYPPMDELKKALEIVCVCIQIACAEKQLALILTNNQGR